MFIFIFVVSESLIFVPQCCSSFTDIEEYEHDSNVFFLWVLSIFFLWKVFHVLFEKYFPRSL